MPRRGMPRGPGPAALCGAGCPQPGARQSRRCGTRTRTRSRAAGLRRRLYPAVYAGSRRRQQSPMAGCFPRAAEVALSTNPPPLPGGREGRGGPPGPDGSGCGGAPREAGRSGEQGRRPHGRAPRPSPSAAPTWRAPGGPGGGQRPCPFAPSLPLRGRVPFQGAEGRGRRCRRSPGSVGVLQALARLEPVTRDRATPAPHGRCLPRCNQR